MSDNEQSLSRQIADAQKRCDDAYLAYTEARRELKRLERLEIFAKTAVRSITEGLPDEWKTL